MKSKNNRINKVDTTNETITGRGGLSLFVRYLENIRIYSLLLKFFGLLRKSKKGKPLWNLFKQILCFFFDHTSRHVSYFDKLKKDKGYAETIENSPEEMASSHAIKRFSANTAYYYFMLIAFFLFKTFQEDILKDVLPITCYATTVRRILIDIPAKIVKKSNQIILKVSKSVMENLRFDHLWRLCQNPPSIPIRI